MIGVKITALLVVVTAIWIFIARSLFHREDMQTQVDLMFTDETTWYITIGGLLVIASIIGIIYSTVYLLFLR